jgi:hypothetical protein
MNSEVPSNPERDIPIDLTNDDRQDLWTNKDSGGIELVYNTPPQDEPIEEEIVTVEAIEPDSQQPPEEVPPVHEWLEELGVKKTSETEISSENSSNNPVIEEIDELERQKQSLIAEIQELQESKESLKARQIAEVEAFLGSFTLNALKDLEEKKNVLTIAVEKLERRRDRIEKEMRTTFAGTSQDLAIRIQGFKDYLVGSLQELANSAEQLQLASQPTPPPPANYPPESREARQRSPRGEREDRRENPPPASGGVSFGENRFQERDRVIRSLLDRYRSKPDYYGPPWQLRRTFEPVHAEKVRNWFFSQGGRGAIRSIGGRLQNVVIAAAVISVLHELHGDRVRTLILANSPERLGEWRRGLQDCLGISRSDYGSSRGVALYESAEALTQNADRLVDAKLIPLIVIDETEEQIDLSLLQYPLWLAFAPDPKKASNYNY